MSKYTDLQNEAKKLGIKKYVGVSTGRLTSMIEEAKKNSPESSTEAPRKNVAIVRNSKEQEIRRYNFETHGDNFAALAEQFAKQHEYNVELVEIESNTVCPNCGHVLEE